MVSLWSGQTRDPYPPVRGEDSSVHVRHVLRGAGGAGIRATVRCDRLLADVDRGEHSEGRHSHFSLVLAALWRRYRRSRNASAEGLALDPRLSARIELRRSGARTEDRADGLRDERAIAAADGDEVELGMAGFAERERGVSDGRRSGWNETAPVTA